MSSSFQLPDLLGLTGSFELRTNRHCRFVTDASEKWFQELPEGVLTAEESARYKPTKAGLLAALCFPTCDLPQLRLLTDFLFVLIVCHERVMGALSPADCGWVTHEMDEDPDPVQRLTKHAVFGHLVPSFSKLVDPQKVRKDWSTRFCLAFHNYHSGQVELVASNSDLKAHGKSSTLDQGADAFLELRRKIGGWDILFLLHEALEDIRYEGATIQELDTLEEIMALTGDTLSWILDIAAYNADQSHNNPHNLISVFMSRNHLSLQGAINYAANQVKKRLSYLESMESLLFSTNSDLRSRPHHSLAAWLPLQLNWTSASAMTKNPTHMDPRPPEALEDLHSVVQNRKDSIVGVSNWIYETELYFGTKGEEVRIFGWVFLTPPAVPETMTGN